MTTEAVGKVHVLHCWMQAQQGVLVMLVVGIVAVGGGGGVSDGVCVRGDEWTEAYPAQVWVSLTVSKSGTNCANACIAEARRGGGQ